MKQIWKSGVVICRLKVYEQNSDQAPVQCYLSPYEDNCTPDLDLDISIDHSYDP